MTDRPSFEAPIEPAAGVRPPTNGKAQRAAEVLADNIRGDQLSTDGFLFVRADQAINAMLDYAAKQVGAAKCDLENAATSQEGDACICGGAYTMCADGHAVNCPASNQLAAYERMTAAQTVRDIAVKTEATRLMFEQIHREGGREVAGHRVTEDMAIMASGVLETVCKDLAAALAQMEAK